MIYSSPVSLGADALEPSRSLVRSPARIEPKLCPEYGAPVKRRPHSKTAKQSF